MKRLLFLVILSLFITACTNETDSSSPTIEISAGSADYKVFESLEELEADADLIVKGKLNGEPTIQKEYQNGTHIYSVRRSEVMIKDVFKGEVSEGETIIVYEPGFVQDNILDTIEGYVPMNKSGHYVLFLQEHLDGEFVVMNDQGKYDVNIQGNAKKRTTITLEELENIDYIGENPDRFNKLKNDVLEKYN